MRPTSSTRSGGFGALTYALSGGTRRPGTYGTIQINSDGSYIYTLTTPFDTSPDANNSANTEESGDSFTYSVTDANGNTATGTITVNIVDDVPTAHCRHQQRERRRAADRGGGWRSAQRRGRGGRLRRLAAGWSGFGRRAVDRRRL